MKYLALLLPGLLLIAGSCSSSGPSPVQDSTAEGSVSYERRAEALGRIKVLHGTYQLVRDSDYQGNGGIIENYDAMNQTMLLWSESWSRLKAHIDQSLGQSIADNNAGLWELFWQQDRLLAEASGQLRRLDLQTHLAKRKLADAPRITYDLPGFNEEIEAMETAITRLTSTMEQLVLGGKEHLNKLEEASNTILEVLELYMKQAYVEANIDRLDNAVAATEALFAAERALGPLERTIQAQYLGLQKVYLAGRYFRASSMVQQLQQSCDHGVNRIRSLNLEPSYKAESQQRIEGLCESAHQLIRAIDDSSTPLGEFVASSLATRRTKVERACADTENRTAFNCELFQGIANIATEQIQSLSKPQLKSLEEAWDLIEGDQP